MEQSEEVVRVLRKHFPKADLGPWPEMFWNELRLTYDAEILPVNLKEEDKRLEDLQYHIEEAAKIFDELHPLLQRELEKVHQANADKRFQRIPRTVTRDRLRGAGSELEVIVPAWRLLERLHLGLLGTWPETAETTVRADWNDSSQNVPQTSAIQAAQELLRQLHTESSQEKAAETWEKVVVVQRARELWERFKGKPAPKRINASRHLPPFGIFLEDLIKALGKNWGVVSALNAWSERA